MNFYLNYFKDKGMTESENEPIGLILFSFEVPAVEASASSSASLRLPEALAPEIASYPSDCKVSKNLFWTGMRCYNCLIKQQPTDI